MKTGFCGDLHLEVARDLGIGEYGEGSRADDQEKVLERTADLFIKEGVDVVCCLGDVFHSPHPVAWAVLAFQRFIRRLVDADIEVIIVGGNHEFKSPTLPHILEAFAGERVTVSLKPDLIPVSETVFATLPWAPLAVLVADVGRPDDLRRQAIDLLAQSLQFLRIKCAAEYPDKLPILLGHWAVSGSTLPTGGSVEEHLSEPIIPWGDIDVLGWKIAAFSHIHNGQLIAQDVAQNPIFYTSSLQVCNLGEIGSPHGVWIYDDEEDDLRFVAIADRPFVDIQTEAVDGGPDVGVMLEPDSLFPVAQDAIVRVKYRSNGLKVDEAQARADLMRMGAHKVFIKEIDRQQVSRARVEGIAEDVSPAEALTIWITSQGFEGPEHDVRAFLDALHTAHAGYVEALT